jgi:hypothetical protein
MISVSRVHHLMISTAIATILEYADGQTSSVIPIQSESRGIAVSRVRHFIISTVTATILEYAHGQGSTG